MPRYFAIEITDIDELSIKELASPADANFDTTYVGAAGPFIVTIHDDFNATGYEYVDLFDDD